MKQISIQDLKAQLSSTIAEAQAGATIIVTRHNQPVAQLGPAQTRHVHRGKGRPARHDSSLQSRERPRDGTLAVLAEDSGDR